MRPGVVAHGPLTCLAPQRVTPLREVLAVHEPGGPEAILPELIKHLAGVRTRTVVEGEGDVLALPSRLVDGHPEGGDAGHGCALLCLGGHGAWCGGCRPRQQCERRDGNEPESEVS